MAKREYPDLKADFRPKRPLVSDNLSDLKEKALNVVKLILGVVLLPFLYSSSVSFASEISRIQKSYQNYFWLGVIIFLIFFLFIWEPEIIYTSGQKLIGFIFNFFHPLVELAPFVLPAYTIILFMVYGLLSLSIKDGWLLQYCLFLVGFCSISHIIFTARALGAKKGDFLKANYIFTFSLIYIVNLFILGLLLSLALKEFSLVDFSKHTISAASNIFSALFKQIFGK
jgi:hypothetical protein